MTINKRKFLKLSALSLASSAVPSALLAQNAQLSVVATTGMIADTVAQIGGDLVQVRALMGPGVDPHAYRQTRSDIVAMTRADMVFWHGLYLEAQMEDFLIKLSKRRNVIAVAETIPKDQLHGHDIYAGRYDPHVWMNPAIWQNVILTVRDTLIKALPDAQAEITTRASAYADRLTALSAYATEVLGSVPAERRVLVTAHDAFGYFGSAYGFEVLGIQGISTESEAGLRRVADLVDTLVKRKIAAVFVESSVSDRNILALIEGAEAQGHNVLVGGELYSDAMGPEGSYEGTYVGMIDHNITVIAGALGGTVPSDGMIGKLTVNW